MKKEFTLRNLKALSDQILQDPSLVEKDWRSAFYNAFDLNDEQRMTLESLDKEDGGSVNALIQDAFRTAAANVRKGGGMRLRVYNEPDKNRRVLRLEMTTLMNEEMLEAEPDTGLDLICCCADCRCWHRCGKRPNPCASC